MGEKYANVAKKKHFIKSGKQSEERWTDTNDTYSFIAFPCVQHLIFDDEVEF